MGTKNSGCLPLKISGCNLCTVHPSLASDCFPYCPSITCQGIDAHYYVGKVTVLLICNLTLSVLLFSAFQNLSYLVLTVFMDISLYLRLFECRSCQRQVQCLGAHSCFIKHGSWVFCPAIASYGLSRTLEKKVLTLSTKICSCDVHNAADMQKKT